jgi:hypothetical protein
MARMTGAEDPQTDSSDRQPEVALLTAALDHAWRWHEFRSNSGLQVLNFYLLAVAVLSTAYVSAINARRYDIAAVVAILGCAVSCATYMVGLRQREVANMAEAPLSEIQDRLATQLTIPSLRMTSKAEETRQTWRSATKTANIVFPLAAAACIGAALYAWLIR